MTFIIFNIQNNVSYKTRLSNYISSIKLLFSNKDLLKKKMHIFYRSVTLHLRGMLLLSPQKPCGCYVSVTHGMELPNFMKISHLVKKLFVETCGNICATTCIMEDYNESTFL
jgi:hypothetical protein